MNAAQQQEQEQQYVAVATVLEDDEYHQVYLEIFPSKADTNPEPKNMTYTSGGNIAMELRLAAIAKGVDPRKFQRVGATEVPNRVNHFLLAVDDEADGREIVKAVEGIIRCIPDVPKAKNKRYDSYQYEYVVRVYDESEQGPALAPKKARQFGEELSVMIKLDCQFHYQFDKTHVALPWEQNGWQVTHVGGALE